MKKRFIFIGLFAFALLFAGGASFSQEEILVEPSEEAPTLEIALESASESLLPILGIESISETVTAPDDLELIAFVYTLHNVSTDEMQKVIAFLFNDKWLEVDGERIERVKTFATKNGLVVLASREDHRLIQDVIEKLEEQDEKKLFKEDQALLGDLIEQPPKLITQIFTLQWANARELEGIISDIRPDAPGTITGDERTNSLIVTGTEDELETIRNLIESLDRRGSRQPDFSEEQENIAYRIYALEKKNAPHYLNRFNLNIQIEDVDSSIQIPNLISSLKMDVFHILRYSSQKTILENGSRLIILEIEGEGTNEEACLAFIEVLRRKTNDKAQLLSLQSEQLVQPNPAPVVIAAPGVAGNQRGRRTSQLGVTGNIQDTGIGTEETYDGTSIPQSLIPTIKKLLGENIVSIGYWFGLSAAEGECSAPIGPWKIEIESHPNMTGAFLFEFSLIEGDEIILHNSVNGKYDKPIIIGYSREVDGKYIPGALVIIPERDWSGSEIPTVEDNTASSRGRRR